MNMIRCLVLVATAGLFITAAAMPASGDDWQLGIDEANLRIKNYERARASGDAQAIRDATVQLQRDPLAVRIVNKTSSEGFKTQLNSDIGDVQHTTRELVKDQLADLGIGRERIGSFEATNKPKPGAKVKVGQDWDFTLRVDGRDVPTRISQPLLEKAYYEGSTGQKPPSLEAAKHHSVRQSNAFTDYQYVESYGGSPREGDAIINGPKDARLRDPTQLTEVIEYKSNEARKLASELRKEGNRGEAVGRDFEEIRQSTKQFDAQVKTRVEGMGGAVPKYIEEGQAILKQVDAGTATPAEAREQLRQMAEKHGVRGETPERFISKTAKLVESAQVLQAPSKRGEAAPETFVENVRNCLASRELNRQLPEILGKLDKGEMTIEQAREQIQQIREINPDMVQKPTGNASGKSPLTEGISSFVPEPTVGALTRKQANNALGALWLASMTGEAGAHEGQRAAQAGEAPNPFRAGGNALLEATMIPGIIRGYKHGQEIGKEELKKAEEEGRGKLDAFARGAGELGKELAAWNIGSEIAQEEIEAEEARAAKEGREPDYSKSAWDGAMRGLGEVLMINSIARSANSLTEEEVLLVGQQQVMRAWTQGKLNENVKELNGIKKDLQEFVATGDPSDPAFKERLKQLSEKYDNARFVMNKLADAAGRQLDENDPLVKAIQDRVGRLPDPPSEEDIQKARSEAALAAAGTEPDEAVPDETPTPPENVEVKRDLAQEVLDLLEHARETKVDHFQKLTQEEWEELRRQARAAKQPAQTPGDQPPSGPEEQQPEIPSREEYLRRATQVADALSEKTRLEERYREVASQLDGQLRDKQALEEYQRSLAESQRLLEEYERSAAEYERQAAEWQDYERRWNEWDQMYPYCEKCGKRHPADWVEQ